MAYTRPAAPGVLARIEAFGNSARFLYGEDALAEVKPARAWLTEHGYPQAAQALAESQRRDLVAVREALRDHIAGAASPATHRILNDHAHATLRRPGWSDTGQPLIAARDLPPVPALIGSLLATLLTEELGGRSQRLKVCHAPECRFLYYDRSSANNSTWCSMSLCGARHKMRAYRSRQRGR